MRVLLGVGGGIAACKAPDLVRRLRESGHEVRCCPTRSALAFVAPLTLEVLSGRPLLTEAYLEAGCQGREEHVEAAAWAEAICVAPATAHLLARLSLGLADDVLTTTALACRAPLLLAPAMHSAMWEKPQVQEHVARLRERGALLVGPVHGPLASGEIGWGRMAEPGAIVEALGGAVLPRPLRGRALLISAGPTREPIDPVRYLGNRSSGRMGFALAAEAARRGAEVALVAGPVELPTPPGVERIDVETAAEMARAVASRAAQADVVVMAAAVADYRPRDRATGKIKREAGPPPTIELVPNPDILAGLADSAPDAFRIGFAAETGEPEAEARAKLARKRADWIVANDVSRPGIGFGSEVNEVTVYRRTGPPVPISRRPKAEVAAALLDLLTEELSARAAAPPRDR